MINKFLETLYIYITQLNFLDARFLTYLALLLCIYIVVKDILSALKIKRGSTGLPTKNEKAVSIDGTEKYKATSYVSEKQGIAGRPDAVIIEQGYYIPVERKPLVNKVRDRHIAQLLVYMRLVEEFEGKKPPYGYLIVGKNARQVKIYNTDERQKWLDEKLSEIKAITKGLKKPTPLPHQKKCSNCKVRSSCSLFVNN